MARSRTSGRRDPFRGLVLGGRYRLGRLIGRGGMAAVHHAVDLQLERPVAVKLLHRPGHQDEEGVVRFAREARLLARLDHAAIVHIFQAGREDDLDWFAMAYVRGRSLHRHLADRKRPLGFAKGLPILRGILEGVEYAHARGIIHRDLKPANVILAEGTRAPVILDFGIAHALESARLTQTGTPLGTPEYMAPEQVRPDLGEIGPATDLYACGVILHEVLTGRPPFPAGSAYEAGLKHLTERLPPLGRRPRGEPPGLEEVLARTLVRDPGLRMTSARELLAALEELAAGRRPALAHPPEAPPRLPGAAAGTTAPASGVDPAPPQRETGPLLPWLPPRGDPRRVGAAVLGVLLLAAACLLALGS